MIRIEVKNLNEALKNFSALTVTKSMKRSIEKSLIYTQWESIKETPIDKGILRAWYRIRRSWDFFGQLVNTKKYWVYVHEWTWIYWPERRKIRPKNSKMLAFKSSWKWIFAKETRWIKPNPFFERAVNKSEKKIEMIFNSEIDKLLANL